MLATRRALLLSGAASLLLPDLAKAQFFTTGQSSIPTISSAGVFDSNGVLVRTLWSAQPDDPRNANPAAVWDGTLDDGTLAPAGTYTVTLLTNYVQYTWEGVIGNTSPDHSNVGLTHIMVGSNDAYIYDGYHSYGGCINDMAITAAGEMYFVTGYDERMNVIHVATTVNPQHANGIIQQGFRSTLTDTLNVCSDGTIAYFHFWDSGGDASLNAIFGINCSTKQIVTFSSGSGSFLGGNFLDVDHNKFIIGLAVQQSHSLALIGRAEVEGALSTTWSIHACNKTTGSLLQINTLGFPFQNRICVDPVSDSPWVSYLKETATASAQWDRLNSSSRWTFSNSDRTVANGTNASIYAFSTGQGTKIYFEVVLNATGGASFGTPFGVASTLGGHNNQGFLGFDNTSAGFYGNGSFNSGSNNVGSGLPTFGVGDNVGIACDAPNKLIWMRVNGGQWNGSPTANPATGVGGLACPTLGSPIVAAVAIDTVGANSQITANFAAANWAFSAPAAFSGLPGVTRSGTVSKLNYNTSTGVLTDSGVTATSGLGSPGGVAVSPDGSTLLVVDGTSQQIKAFNTSDGSVKVAWGSSGTLGDAGGYSNGPAVSNTRFMFGSDLGFSGTGGWIAYASDGSFWFADAGNSRYLHFSAGNSPTYIEQIGYFPGFYAAGVCGNDPTRVFGGYLEYAIDYTKPLAPGNGSWTLTNNWGFNPPGGNLGNSDQVMRYATKASNGRTYIPLGPQHAVAMYEMTSTGYRLASPVDIQADYVDKDLNLWHISGGGFGTSAQFFVNRLTGFDGSNNPIWQNSPLATPSNLVVATATPVPANFPEISIETNRSMSVETLANGVIPVFNVHGTPGSNPLTQPHFGGIDSTTGAFKFATHYPQTVGFTGAPAIYPPPPVFCVNVVSQVSDVNGLIDRTGVGDNAGGFQSFVPGTSDVFTFYRGEAWTAQQTSFWSHWHQSGLLVNRVGVAAPYFAQGFNTLMNPQVFNPASIHALDALPPGQFMPMNQTFGFMGSPGLGGNVSTGSVALVNGTYYLYHPDEWYHGGVHRWKVSGANTINLTSQTVTFHGGMMPPAPNPYNFLAGLPFAVNSLPNNTGGWTRSPATDTVGPSANRSNGPWFRIGTNGLNCDRAAPPDLFIEGLYTTAFNATATYSWSRLRSGNWSITGSILQNGVGNHSLNNPETNFYMDVLDNAGNRILRMVNEFRGDWPGPITNGVCFFINGAPAFTGGIDGFAITTPLSQPRGYWTTYISQQPQPLKITANVLAGTMTVSYAGFTVTGIPVFDLGADINHPAQFRITYKQDNLAGTNRISLFILSMVFADT